MTQPDVVRRSQEPQAILRTRFSYWDTDVASFDQLALLSVGRVRHPSILALVAARRSHTFVCSSSSEIVGDRLPVATPWNGRCRELIRTICATRCWIPGKA